jgi:hypothetical protein
MAVEALDPPPLLARGRVDRLRVQVAFRPGPDDAADRHFLLDVPAPEDGLDEGALLGALEPAVHAGVPRPRHHSVHVHRWHTSWGARDGALDVDLLVTSGTAPVAYDDVVAALRDVLALVRAPASGVLSRDSAVQRARHAVASAYGLDGALHLSSEEHHPGANAWTIELRRPGEEFLAIVGCVDGYAGSVDVRRKDWPEVSDLGPE